MRAEQERLETGAIKRANLVAVGRTFRQAGKPLADAAKALQVVPRATSDTLVSGT
jgi:hypothetical protein